MATTTKVSVESVNRISGGTPNTDRLTNVSVTDPDRPPSGVTVSVLGVLNTNCNQVVIQINTYDTEDISNPSLEGDVVQVPVENDSSNGVSYIGVTLSDDATTTLWSFDMNLSYGGGKKFKYTIGRM